jgi:hypothetical protein
MSIGGRDDMLTYLNVLVFYFFLGFNFAGKLFENISFPM